MEFKFILVSVACLAFLISPAHSGDIVAMKSAAKEAVSDIVSIVPRVMKAKGNAVIKGATDIASIIARGIGLKVRALAKASSSIKGAISDGFISVGDTISEAGNSIVAAKSGSGSRNSRIVVTPVERVEEVEEVVKVKRPTVVEEIKVMKPIVLEEEIVAEPCQEEYIEVPVQSFPISAVQVRVQPPRRTVFEPSPRLSFINDKISSVTNGFSSVLNKLKNAAQMKVNTVGNLFNVLNSPIRSNRVYEIIETPRVYQGPLIETFKIEKN